MMAEMVAVLRARGQTLLRELDDIYRRYGLFVSSQVNLTRKGASGAREIAALMERLRAVKPARIGAHAVVAISDYAAQTRTLVSSSATASGEKSRVTKLELPPSNVVSFELEGGSRIIARPSGTEPKVKFYFDVREPILATESTEAATVRAQATMAALSEAFVKLSAV
jgi:phosphomannomutase